MSIRSNRTNLFLWALVLGLGPGCAATGIVRQCNQAAAELPKGARIAVLPLQVLTAKNVQAKALAYSPTLVVGHMHHSGGYVHSDDGSQFVQSKNVQLSRQSQRRQSLGQWWQTLKTQSLPTYFSTHLLDSVSEHGEALNRLPLQLVPEPQGDLSRRDNVDLPTFATQVLSDWTEMPALNADYVFLPVVVYAYTHNTGWYRGQKWGAHAGGRMRFVWALYRKDGQLVQAEEREVKVIREGLFHPDALETQDIWDSLLERMTGALF